MSLAYWKNVLDKTSVPLVMYILVEKFICVKLVHVVVSSITFIKQYLP